MLCFIIADNNLQWGDMQENLIMHQNHVNPVAPSAL